MFKKFVAFVFIFLFARAGFCLEMNAQALAWADASVKAIYGLDFDTAEYYINKLTEQNPDFPIALFGKTMIEWSRFEYEYEKSSPEQAKKFEATLASAIEGIENWLKNNQPDAYAYLALGGVYGIKGRFELANRSYISAYFTGKKGLRYMNKAFKLDPQMYDALLGEGVYQYYAGTLPAVVKILAKLVISGNADKGIEYLNLVKDKGRFSADSAKLLLVEIAIESDKYHNPPLAREYISEIIAKYPKNPLYRFVGIIAAYEDGDYDTVIREAKDFLSKIGKEKFYNEIYIARAYAAIAAAQMAQGDFEAARATLEAAQIATANQEPSRWQLWNKLRLSQVYDVLGMREKALEGYREVIKQKQNWGMDDVARQYVRKPFTADTPLGRMSPP